MPEKSIVLRHCKKINPLDITTFLSAGGFHGLKRARQEMSPKEVIEEVKASQLRGRGGAGFPCGAKWEMAAAADGAEKFFICNADEGEMGTFKDRHMLENDPLQRDRRDPYCVSRHRRRTGFHLSARGIHIPCAPPPPL